MARYQRLSAAFVERLDAAVASVRDDDYVPVDMSFMDDLKASLDADRDGRPYSRRPRTAYDDARDEQRLKDGGGPCDLSNPDDPGARMLRDMKRLKAMLDADPDTATLHEQLAQAKKDTIAEIQREQRERRERQRAKRQRRAQRQRLAAVQASAPADVPT